MGEGLTKQELDAICGKDIIFLDRADNSFSGRLISTFLPTLRGYEFITREHQHAICSKSAIVPGDIDRLKDEHYEPIMNSFSFIKSVGDTDNTYLLFGEGELMNDFHIWDVAGSPQYDFLDVFLSKDWQSLVPQKSF